MLKQTFNRWYVYPCATPSRGKSLQPSLHAARDKSNGKSVVYTLSTFNFPYDEQGDNIVWIEEWEPNGSFIGMFGYGRNHGSDTSKLVIICCLFAFIMFLWDTTILLNHNNGELSSSKLV